MAGKVRNAVTALLPKGGDGGQALDPLARIEANDGGYAMHAQATKEAEYREKVADLKARIDSCTARVTSEEEQVNTAKVMLMLASPSLAFY